MTKVNPLKTMTLEPSVKYQVVIKVNPTNSYAAIVDFQLKTRK